MAIRIYDPNDKTFKAYDPKLRNGDFSPEILLLNILVELQVQNALLESNYGYRESLEKLRENVVTEY